MWGVHAGRRQAVRAVKTMLSLSETLLAVGTLLWAGTLSPFRSHSGSSQLL